MTYIIVIVGIIGVIFFINKKFLSWQNLYDTGLSHYRAGKYMEAITYLLKAIKKNPNNPEIICCYGDSCLKQSLKLESLGVDGLGFKKLAISAFIESLTLAPYDYHSNQMIEKINAIIMKEHTHGNAKAQELINDTENMIYNLPSDLRSRFNFT
jgi:tetratricopeptide (TPR) repeat protein